MSYWGIHGFTLTLSSRPLSISASKMLTDKGASKMLTYKGCFKNVDRQGVVMTVYAEKQPFKVFEELLYQFFTRGR